ncbi:uncharacterized protein LY89DRAFT_267716 [Mollisia scopiformis]|uniref:Uncharacterized protein n=1 Tax=Mollisia scopiformis TaxID=149040 RepID=A0A132BC48_MOLSC|nr:uncharacterized protein LY89DRAFT_267716 [Mollisia scopiformis]KUJ09985.1 hypothetical protein LY89DRAFT_267716 [Mollisia scopiformis]
MPWLRTGTLYARVRRQGVIRYGLCVLFALTVKRLSSRKTEKGKAKKGRRKEVRLVRERTTTGFKQNVRLLVVVKTRRHRQILKKFHSLSH